jgi:hypothetical protein
MEITGKLSQVLPTERGIAASGEWFKTVAIFDISSGNYTDKLAVTFFKTEAPSKIGATYNVQLNVKSREHNGRWYTEAGGWKFNLVESEQPAASGQPQGERQPKYENAGQVKANAVANNNVSDPDSGLPF